MKKLSIQDGLATILEAVRLWWSDWSNQLVVSLVAILVSLTVIFYPVALFGVFEQASDLTHDLRTGLGGFWSGLKKYLTTSLIWGLVNTLGIAIFSLSFWFYSNSSFFAAPIFVWASFLGLGFWLTWQFLSVACFFLQETKTLRLAWKNGLVLLLSHPLYLLPISVFLLVLTLSSFRYFLPLLAGSEALIAIISLRAVQKIIKADTAEN